MSTQQAKSLYDLNTPIVGSYSYLHLAAEAGIIDEVMMCLCKGANVNLATDKGETALHLACADGHLEIVKALIANGANINAQSKTGFTPLHCASQEGRTNIVSYLLEKGADPNIADNNGKTACEWALELDNKEIYEILKNANPTKQP